MRIVFLFSPIGNVIAREEIDGVYEGEFLLTEAGMVQYRHLTVELLFANTSFGDLKDCVKAWDAYCQQVRSTNDEAAQLAAVEVLREALAARGALEREGFWTMIMEQAENGML